MSDLKMGKNEENSFTSCAQLTLEVANQPKLNTSNRKKVIDHLYVELLSLYFHKNGFIKIIILLQNFIK